MTGLFTTCRVVRNRSRSTEYGYSPQMHAYYQVSRRFDALCMLGCPPDDNPIRPHGNPRAQLANPHNEQIVSS